MVPSGRQVGSKGGFWRVGKPMQKKHEKVTKEKKGGIISKENFIHMSNLKSLETKVEKKIDKK